ncbi:MAG: hypothetical protein CMG66_00205 [Candidatus Marinimicrobia bacterium]|nr:hypothetical protein [Candidatus Neomarinimicrobiota bacterium]|tara:strand:- start:1185 stop:2006 length:822 start_codon:yes stop_codon:yes gene_type:complete
MLKTNNPNIIFIHANGFPPDSYKPLFQDIETNNNLEKYLLRPLWKKDMNPLELKDWNLFHNDFKSTLDTQKKYIGIGHSIGGNIILRTAISDPKYFSKIILLDPTLFVPRIIYLWKIAFLTGFQNQFHPWIKSTLKRKMSYDNYTEIFNSYRKKHVFSKINDKNLKIYIRSITSEKNKQLFINYSKAWEYQIYKTGLLADMFIWKNIKNIKIPCLIIRAEESNAFLNSSQNKIEKNNSNIKFTTIKNSSHLFPLEYPEKTSKIIKSFIDNQSI